MVERITISIQELLAGMRTWVPSEVWPGKVAQKSVLESHAHSFLAQVYLARGYNRSRYTNSAGMISEEGSNECNVPRGHGQSV